MWTWNKTLLGLILASILKNTTASRVRSLTTFIGFDTRQLISNSATGIGMEDTSLYQVKCTRLDPKEIKCSLTVITSSFDNNTSRQACEFYLTTLLDTKLNHILQIYRLGKEKYLVSFVEYYPNTIQKVKHINGREMYAWIFVKFVIVELPLCLTSISHTVGTSTSVSLDNFLDILSIQLYQDHFDVFYPYSSTYDLAQESFDSKGVRIYGPVGKYEFKTGPDAETILPWWMSQISNSCLKIVSQERVRTTPGHRMEDVPSSLLDREDFAKRNFRGWSTANGNVSFCKTLEDGGSIWKCAQGSSNDSLKVFQPEFDHVPLNSVIYNLPGGGLLALTSSGPKWPITPETELSFHLIKIDATDGQKNSTNVIMSRRQSCAVVMILANFFQDENGDLCVSLVPLDNDPIFSTSCYSRDLLTMRQQIDGETVASEM